MPQITEPEPVEEVMVLPRGLFEGQGPFVKWSSLLSLAGEMDDAVGWMSRAVAESSETSQQPIACAYVRSSSGQYCMLRQGEDPNEVLHRRRTLVVGGHIGFEDRRATVLETIRHALQREVLEEIGLDLRGQSPRPVGVVVDRGSEVASRHVGFVFEIGADRVEPLTVEEFTLETPLGTFVDIEELVEWRDEFDPWSALLIDVLSGGGFQPCQVDAAPSRQEGLK